jgi:hypothetical protein
MFLFLSSILPAQVSPVDSILIDSLGVSIINSEEVQDSVDMQVIMLREIIVFNRPEFKTWEDRKRYYILRRKTKKVYPYAVLAAKRLTELDKRLGRLDTKKKKKKYIKIVEDYIQNEFGPKLKKFTQSEGRILIKLIYRQIGVSTFDLLRKYKSGWKAFWSNATANIFNLSLKATYNPFKYKEDLSIEAILRESFENGSLEYESAFWEELNPDDTYFTALPDEKK